MIHYGAKLKHLREEKGITQDSFSQMMGRSQNAVSSIERNVCPTLENIILYLDTLNPNIQLYQFFKTEEDHQKSECQDCSYYKASQQFLDIFKNVRPVMDDIRRELERRFGDIK